MNSLNGKKHHVDLIFALALFCVFAATAFILVVLGGSVYKKTVSGMNNNFNTRTALAYITEKMRQCDERGAFEVAKTDAGDTLVIHQKSGDVEYSTYIYENEGYLCEMVAMKNMEFTPEGGDKLLEIKDFAIEKSADSLYKFSMDPVGSGQVVFYISPESEN